MKNEEKNGGIISEINVTPLVDITLVLLIIFMTTATLILRPSINVSLPRAKTAETTKTSPLGIVIDKNDNIYLNGKPVTEEELRKKIREILKEQKIPEVIIAADKDVKHGYFIHVLDIVREEGVTKFAINVEPVR